MRRVTYIAIFMLVSLALTTCAGNGDLSVQKERLSDSDIAPSPEQESVEESKADNDDGTGGRTQKTTVSAKKQNQVSLDKAGQSKEETAKSIERKIIRNASLQLEATSPEEVQQKITAIAEGKKGFVIQSRKSSGKNRGRDTVSMSIRIPAESFNETLAEIRKTANRVIDESVTGRDVTEEFIDIEARLKTKKALEERFLDIMKQSRSVQDALTVQRQLANVRGEIEQIEGRKRFLENQSSLSTIKINIQTPTALSGSSSGFFYELKEAVSDGFDSALGFILILVRVLIAIIPFFLLIVLPVFLLLRYFWRNYKKRRLAKRITEEINDEIINE